MRINTRLRMNAAIILGLLLLMTAALGGTARTTTVADADATLAGKMQKAASGRVLVRDDYLIRHSERARIQWEAQTETFRGLLAQARDQLPAADQPILDGIESDFVATVSIFHQIVEIEETPVSAGADGLPSPEGKQRLVSQLLLQAYSLNDRVLELRDTTQAAAGASRTLLTWLMFSFVLVATIATLVNSGLIRRLLTRRIEQLREGMDIIGAGRLDHHIPVAGNDELSDLACAGNAMAVRLMETTTSVENLQREVAERKRAEEAVLASEVRYRRLFESAKDGILILDAETGMVEDVNPFLVELLGSSREAILKKKIWELGFFKDIIANQAHFAELKQKEYVRYEDRPLETAAGRRIDVEFVSNVYLVNHNKVVQCNIRDITERKRAEKTLLESETQYRKLIETMQDGVYRSSHEGKFLEVNPAMVKILGYDSKEELLAIDIKSQLYFAPQDRESAALDEKLSEMGVFRLRKKDGSEIWVEDHGRHVVDDAGTVLYHEGVLRDITERKQAEHQNMLLAQMLKSAKDCISITDLEDNILFVNDAFLSTYGHAEADLLGKKISIVRSPKASPNEVGKILPATLEGGWHGEVSNRRKDGTEFPVELWTTLVRDTTGAPIAMAGVARDITERKRAEKELRESEERFRTLVENAPEPVFIQTEGRFVYLNRVAVAEFGAESADQLIGTLIFDRLHPDVHAIVRERIKQLNQGREKVPLLEEVYLRMDGTPFAVEVSAVPFSYQGRPGALVFLHSIEERKQLEREMAKARTDFLYAVSHELKTPLFLMTATMELIKSQSEGERQRQFLAQEETWIRNLARLRLLINNLVDSQRTADLGTQLNRTPTDLATLVRQATQDLDVFAVKQSVTWQLDLDSLPDLPLDLESIERTLHNLLTNAIKFSPPGGTVHVRLHAQPDRAVLEVEDHGKGISAESLSHLFQPFARSSSAVKAVIPGTGLGLYVSKILVEAHGGSISLQSTEGLGTTVTVTLPLRE